MLKYLLQAAVVAGAMHFIIGNRLEQGTIIRTVLAVALAFLLLDNLVPRLLEGLSIDPNYGYSRAEIAALQREYGPTSRPTGSRWSRWWSGDDWRNDNQGASRWGSGDNSVSTFSGLSCKRTPSCRTLKRLHNQKCNARFGYDSAHNSHLHRNRKRYKISPRRSNRMVYI